MQNQKTITVTSLVLMIIGGIFGMSNSMIGYYQMGYASIIWYLLAAIVFFLPMALMFAEYGSSLKNSSGGIYSWLEASIGEKWSFIGTFIWYAAWLIWMTSTSSKIWIPFSTLISGSDKTQTWSLFGLNGTQTIGILAIIWMIIITIITNRGIKSVTAITSISGFFMILLPIVFSIVSIVLIFANHGQLAQPVTGIQSFTASPNPSMQGPIALVSFAVYAIYAYGGMETFGGITDKLKHPTKTFPRGLIIAAILMAVLYIIGIFFCGFSVNWKQTLGGSNVNLGNITYALMDNLGVTLGHSLGMSSASSIGFGHLLSRFAGLSMFIGYAGSFFIILYSPIKSFIMGAKNVLPKKITKVNKYDMPANAIWIQTAVVIVIVALISFGGTGAQKFYQTLTNMTNVSTASPYLFFALAFPFFKKRKDLERPFVFFKTQRVTNIVSAIVFIVIAASIIFTAIQPLLEHDFMTFFWTVIGPIVFGGVAWITYDIIQAKKPVTNGEKN